MRRALLVLAALLPAPAQITSPAVTPPSKSDVIHPATVLRMAKGPAIPRATFDGLERNFDGLFNQVGDTVNLIDLLGNTRGVYLEGYGAVFTTELSLVATPGPSPFLTTIPKELVVRTHQKKVERLPGLRKAMKEMMRIAGLTLVQMPESQQIVMVVRLDYRKWEDTSGLPGQILMRTDRKSAMLGEVTTTEEQ